MSEWTDGYRAALADFELVAFNRGWGAALTKELRTVLADLHQDALVIEHEQSNKLQKRRLAAAREALPLFADVEK